MPIGFAGIKDITSFPIYFLSKEVLFKRLETLKSVLRFSPQYGRRHIHLKESKSDFVYKCPICGRRTTHNVYSWNDIFELDKIRELSNDIKNKGFDIYLEERNFCSNCRVQADMFGKKLWKVQIDGKSFYVPAYFCTSDCYVLRLFLTAHDKTDYDKIIDYLRGDISRLEDLLGFNTTIS